MGTIKNMSVSELKIQLCDRYHIAHSSSNESVLLFLSKDFLKIKNKYTYSFIDGLCFVLSIDKDKLLSGYKAREYSDATKIGSLYALDILKLHPKVIGSIFNKNRTSILAAIKTCNQLIESDSNFSLKTTHVFEHLNKLNLYI